MQPDADGGDCVVTCGVRPERFPGDLILTRQFSGGGEGREVGAVAREMPGWTAGRRAWQSCLSSACSALRDCPLLLLFPLILRNC